MSEQDETYAPVIGTVAGDKGDIATLVKTALAAANPRELSTDTPQVLVLPDGSRAHVPDVESFLPAPRRKTGAYVPDTVESFTAYVQWHEDEEHTTVWVHPTSGRITAVLNDHSADAPAWRDHTVNLKLLQTPEWTYWLEKDGQLMSQEQFAEHIEGGLREISRPDAATMLEIAQTFHASTEATFRSSTRLHSGEQKLQYDESVQAAAGTSGELTVPTELVLGIAPFVGEEAYELKARLRFRLSRGQLALGYLLDRPDRIVRDALDHIAAGLKGTFPHVFVGSPPA
jgi:uncharacterized protein YfdQ (DUF2303 family)